MLNVATGWVMCRSACMHPFWERQHRGDDEAVPSHRHVCLSMEVTCSRVRLSCGALVMVRHLLPFMEVACSRVKLSCGALVSWCDTWRQASTYERGAACCVASTSLPCWVCGEQGHMPKPPFLKVAAHSYTTIHTARAAGTGQHPRDGGIRGHPDLDDLAS